jgi:cell wall-associated NlpC family hydrolase
MVESGLNPRALGDGGHSGGLFQENDWGRGSGIPMADRFNPDSNAARAAKEFRTFRGRGKTGAALAYAAQRPADMDSYIQKVQSRMAEARNILRGYGVSTPLTGPASTPLTGTTSTSTGTGQGPDLGGAIATGLVNRRPGESLASTIANAVVSAGLSVAGTKAISERHGVKVNPAGGLSTVVDAAKGRLGTPYSWGGGTPSGPTKGFGRGANTVGFDCSSLVQYAWAKAGVHLPRTTYEQIKVGRGVSTTDMSQWRPGDLLFPHAGHVQMYIGNGKLIQAPRTGGVVEIKPVSGHYIAVRRPSG